MLSLLGTISAIVSDMTKPMYSTITIESEIFGRVVGRYRSLETAKAALMPGQIVARVCGRVGDTVVLSALEAVS